MIHDCVHLTAKLTLGPKGKDDIGLFLLERSFGWNGFRQIRIWSEAQEAEAEAPAEARLECLDTLEVGELKGNLRIPEKMLVYCVLEPGDSLAERNYANASSCVFPPFSELAIGILRLSVV